MKNHLFVVGDVHGEIRSLQEVLHYWNPTKEQLVFVGDLIDRGENPKKCLELVRELVEQGAICLRGNHEDLLLDFLSNPTHRVANYFLNGGDVTIRSLLGQETSMESPEDLAHRIQTEHSDLIAFIKEMPFYYEWHDILVVHAGINPQLADWHMTSERDFTWIREEFYSVPNNVEKKIVFGHSPTGYIRNDLTDFSPWIKDNKIGIDGGAVYGGYLYGARFEPTKLKSIVTVSKDERGVIHSCEREQ